MWEDPSAYGFTPLASRTTDTVCLGPGDETNVDPKHSLQRVGPLTCKYGEAGARCHGLVARMVFVCRKCDCNMHNALCQRHLAKQPLCTADFSSVLGALDTIWLQLGYSVAQHEAVCDAWWAKWPAAKRKVMETSVAADGVYANRVKTMVKREILRSMPTKARAIQYYPNEATKCAFGPEFYMLQKAVVATFTDLSLLGCRVWFASGMNASQLGQWMADVYSRYRNPVFYERDGKNWDSTMQMAHHTLKRRVYELAGMSVEFLRFVDAGARVSGTFSTPCGKLKYRSEGTTKSGHNDTTLGNSIINALLAVWACHGEGLSASVIVAGDDLLLAAEGDFDEHALAARERSAGIVPEYRKLFSWRDVSFISGIWFRSGARFVFVPKPGRLLAGLFWTTQVVSRRKVAGFRRGIVLGLRPSCWMLPVVATFLNVHDDGYSVPFVLAEKQYHLVYGNYQVADPGEVYSDFLMRYSTNVEEIQSAEGLLRECSGLEGFVSHPLIQRMVAYDIADLGERHITTPVGPAAIDSGLHDPAV